MPTLRLFLFKIKKSNKRNEVSALVVFHAKALFTRIPTPILVSILWIPMADAWKNNSMLSYPHTSLHSMDTYGRCLERDSLANNRTFQCLLYSMLALFTRITQCYPTPIQVSILWIPMADAWKEIPLAVFHAKALFTRITPCYPTPIQNVSVLAVFHASALYQNNTMLSYPHTSLHSMDTYGRCLERDSLAADRMSQCLLYFYADALNTIMTRCYPTPI
ncbi:hypothetical protein G9A89_008416 [Geosiphon pyriformis]|nr:hypothetical protein G9A89_008416 [Geosiphon pyriformis]